MSRPLPPAFVDRMKLILGNDGQQALSAAIDAEPPVSVRFNPSKPSGLFADYRKVDWCREAVYLPERISFTRDPLFHAGCYYVQEPCSMLVGELFRAAFPVNDKPLKVLDLCAAPGGKSTHLLSLLNDESILVSNEVIASRNAALRHNLARWGYANVVVTQLEVHRMQELENFFDLILVDAPCSGEGLFRKDQASRDEWSPHVVQQCAARQKDILQDTAPLLKPGGYLIYSTCTYSNEENDQQVKQLLETGEFTTALPPALHPSFVYTYCGIQCYPHRVEGEGFYISMLRKNDGNASRYTSKRSGIDWLKLQHKDQWLKNADDYSTFRHNEQYFAFPASCAAHLDELLRRIPVRQAGLALGEMKGNDLIPAASLALSRDIAEDIPDVTLKYDEAIRYLKCEDPGIRPERKGWMTVSYAGHRLGWIKSLQGRINNYFPREWRILK